MRMRPPDCASTWRAHGTRNLSCTLETDETGRHAKACDIRFKNRDTGDEYVVRGDWFGPVFVEEPVPSGGVCLINDAPSRFQINDQVAFGTIEARSSNGTPGSGTLW